MKINAKYNREELSTLLINILSAVKTSNRQTESERAVSLIDRSIDRDIAESARKTDHGYDVLTIISEARQWLGSKIAREQKEQNLAMARAMIKSLNESLRFFETLESELSGELGVGGIDRVREIAEISRRAEYGRSDIYCLINNYVYCMV